MSTVEWFEHEGAYEGMNELGETVAEIAALQDRASCTKWGERYEPGRAWIAWVDGERVEGRATDARAAKRAILLALK